MIVAVCVCACYCLHTVKYATSHAYKHITHLDQIVGSVRALIKQKFRCFANLHWLPKCLDPLVLTSLRFTVMQTFCGLKHRLVLTKGSWLIYLATQGSTNVSKFLFQCSGECNGLIEMSLPSCSGLYCILLCGYKAMSACIYVHIIYLVGLFLHYIHMHAQSRVSVEKKDYFDSKLMLHWSYICTFAGCLVGWMSSLGG